MLAWARRGREHVGGNPGADDADAQNHIIIIANLEVSHGARSQKERLGSVSAQLRCMLCAYIAGRIVDRAELDGGSRHVHTRQRKSKEGFLDIFSFISRSDDELPDHSIELTPACTHRGVPASPGWESQPFGARAPLAT